MKAYLENIHTMEALTRLRTNQLLAASNGVRGIRKADH